MGWNSNQEEGTLCAHAQGPAGAWHLREGPISAVLVEEGDEVEDPGPENLGLYLEDTRELQGVAG